MKEHTCDHVFDKMSMNWCINKSSIVCISLEFAKWYIDSNPTFSRSFDFIHKASIFKWTFVHLWQSLHYYIIRTKINNSYLISFFLECFNHSFVNSITLVDEITNSCRFSGMNMTNDDNINIALLFIYYHKWKRYWIDKSMTNLTLIYYFTLLYRVK